MRKHNNTHKKVYRVKNWATYNQALVQRGSLDIWLSEESQASWYAQASGQPGAPEKYSADAIRTSLTIRKLFSLPLRQTEGFVQSVFRQTKVALDAPDYSTLSRRGRFLLVRLSKRKKAKTTLVIDSSGVKVYGAGEWNQRKHNPHRGRKWKKIHIAVDENGEVRATDITDEDTGDPSMVKSLFSQEEAVIELTAMDGAYDTEKVYTTCQQQHITHIVIPPRKDAVIWQHGNRNAPPHPRDENLREIRQHGRKQWKHRSGYHVRSLAESFFFRFKTILGDRVSSRENTRQITELKLAVCALNRMFELGM